MSPRAPRRHRHPVAAFPTPLQAASLALLAALALVPRPAAAQVTIKPDGQWRHLVTAGLNVNSGNTESTAVNLSTDSVRATDRTKWSAIAQLLYASSQGTTTGERALVSSQYNTDLWTRSFAFVQAAALRDKPANISDRFSATTGLGRHLMQGKDGFWDVWGGVSVSRENYVAPAVIDGRLRSHFNDAGLVLAEESNLKLGQSTSFRQKLVLLPSLRQSGQMRTEFDSQVSVAMNATMSLSVGLALRHNTDPAPGLKRLDAALVSGLSMRFD